MSPELQQIKIAEACGWTFVDFQGIILCREPEWEAGRAKTLEAIPNYLNDLNAMHKAKQALWKMDWDYRYIFNDHLANIIKGRIVNRNEWDAETLLDATAEQQAESFLRTLNLWVE